MPSLDDDLDDVARKIVEEGGQAPSRRAPTDHNQAAAASNIVRLPGSRLPPRLSGIERDAFERIAETLGGRQGEAKAALKVRSSATRR